jgi:hypothetical protein
MAADKQQQQGGKRGTLSVDRTPPPALSGRTVTVGSKLPMSYVLQLHHKVERTIQAHGGTHKEVISLPTPSTPSRPTRFVVDGCAFPQNKGPHQQIVAGFALTHGVPKEFWDAWLEQYGEMDLVKNGFLFAHEEQGSAVANAKEMEGEASGFERIDPQKKYNVGRKIQVNDKAKELVVEQEAAE